MNSSIFRLSTNARVECLRIGQEQESLVLVDDFMAGISELKAFAVEHNNFAPVNTYYPGIRMPVPKIYLQALVANLGEVIEKAFGLHPKKITGANSLFSIVTRQPSELDLLQKIPHFDAPSRNSLATVHYLSEDPSSGTALYRHRQTGYEYIDKERMDGYFHRVQDEFKHKTPEGYVFGSTDEYEQIESFTAKLNRILIYRASSLHSGVIPPGHDFNPDPATGRLTITSFFHFA